MGPRSDFSRPRQGVAEKSANATRKAVSARCRFLDPQERLPRKMHFPEHLSNRRQSERRTRTIMTKGRVSSWRWYPAFGVISACSFMGECGILSLVQQIETCKVGFNSMNISELSSEYEVRKLTEDDGDRISEKRN